MAAIQTRPYKIGNFVKKEFWTDEMWCREAITITYAGITAANRVNGQIVYKATAGATKYVAMPATVDVALGKVAIVIDNEFENLVKADEALGSPTGDVVVTALVRGQAVIRRGGLTMVDATDATDVYTMLDNQYFKLVTSFSPIGQAVA
jgi:hypothetical protein